MNRRSTLFSGVLLLALLAVPFLFKGDVVRGLTSSSDVSLSVDGSSQLLGKDIVFTGALTIAADEAVSISGVTLSDSTGPQSLSVDLPVADTSGQFVDISSLTSVTTDKLLVKVTLSGVTSLGTTLPGTLPSTLPSGTLPVSPYLSSGGNFQGSSNGGTIAYVVKWTPGVNLDPAPALTLIPDTDVYFTIPTLSAPEVDESITRLPDTGLKFEIPVAGETSGTAVPDSGDTFSVPTITLSTNAPSAVSDLPDSTAYMGTGATTTSGFAIPTASVVTSTAASFPKATDAFVIPSPTVETSAISSFGDGADAQWLVPDASGATTTAQSVNGMTFDGTDFWFILAGATRDTLVQVNTSGIRQASVVLPSKSFQGVTSVGSSLYLLENKHRCGGQIDTEGTCSNSRIYKILASDDLPSTGAVTSNWAAGENNKVTLIFGAGEQHDEFAGLTTSDSYDLWTIDDRGDNFRNVRTTGVSKSDHQPQSGRTQADSIAFSANLLYTAKSGTITQWTDDGTKITSWDQNSTSIKAMAFDGNTLYFVNNDDGQLYATFVGMSVTSPIASKGIAFQTDSGDEYLWVLVEGTPKDYIVKVDPSDGSLVTSFSDDGWVQAPSSNTEGIEYFDGYLYVISNEGNNWESPRKIWKLNATTGAVEDSKNLKDLSDHLENLGDLTNDGTSLISWSQQNFNDKFTINTSFSQINSNWVDGVSWQGSGAIAYHPVQKLLYAVSGVELSKINTTNNQVGTATLAVDPDQSGANSFSDVQGMTFSDSTPYNDLWFVAGTRVYHSFIAEDATTKPKAIAWSSSDLSSLGSTASLWVIVDGDPFDKILRINTDDGSLNTSFDTDGVADAPSGEIEGAVFVTEGSDNFLYMIANDAGQDQWNKKRNLYKYNVKTRAVASGYPINLQDTANVWEDVGALAYNGDYLIVIAKNQQNIWKVGTDGSGQGEAWPCCSMEWGGFTGLAYHTTRGALYGVLNKTLLGISPSLGMDTQFLTEQKIKLDGSNLSSGTVGGLTFGGDVLYIARTVSDSGYILASAFASSITTKPQGLALSPSSSIYQGTNVGAALWVLVDGTPNDRVIKLTGSGSSWSVDTGFGSDETKNGSAELPNSTMTGITYYDNALWAIGGSMSPTLYKLNPTTGAELDSYALCAHTMHGGGGGPMFCDAPGGLTWDGTNFIATPAGDERFYFLDTSGSISRESNGCCQLNGTSAIEKIQDDNTYWVAKGNQIQQFINPYGNDLWPAKKYTMTGTLNNIGGLVVDQATKTFFIGWNDGSDGFISQAVPPSPITNKPQDLAYNATDQELYLLVDGEGGDAVVVVNASTGAILKDATNKERFVVLNTEDAEAIAYHDGKIYVAYEGRGGHGGPPPLEVSVRNVSDLAEVQTFNVDEQCGRLQGLDSDGTSIIAVVERCGPKVETYDAGSMYRTQETYFWSQQPMNIEGFTGVAYSSDTPLYFTSKGSSIYRVDDGGQVIDEWTLNGVNSITGIEFVGEVLYITDFTSGKVYTAQIPTPDTTFTNTPRAMTSDGTSLFVAVDAEPVDKIIKMSISDGSFETSFDSPGTETAGIAIHDGKLWVITNDTQNVELPGNQVVQMTVPVLSSHNKSNGNMDFMAPLVIDMGGGQSDIIKDRLGGLASDGNKLYTGTTGESPQANGALYSVDPNDFRQLCMFGKCFSAPYARAVQQYNGVLTKLGTMQAFEIAPDSEFSSDRRLIVAGGAGYGNLSDMVSRFDIDAVNSLSAQGSVMRDQYTLASGTDIQGMALVGTVLYFADYAGTITGTALPENTGVEMTIVGNYETQLSAITENGTLSSSAAYSVVRNSDVAIMMTSPVNHFVATSTEAILAGLVSDPSVASVSVGIELPFTEFLNDSVTDSTFSSNWSKENVSGDGSSTWYVAKSADGELPGGSSVWGDSALRFGVAGTKSFDQPGARVSAHLTSKSIYPIASGSQLTFQTAWGTEFFPEADMKLVQIAEVTSDLQGNDVVGAWKKIAQIVMMVDPYMMTPQNAHPQFQWVVIDPLPFRPGQSQFASVDLSGLAGKRIKVRFTFDSVDEWANEGRGWFIDDITLSGSGTKTVSVNTTVLDTPLVKSHKGQSVTMYRSFSTSFDLAEGENTVVATASQSYAPNLSDSTTVKGFVDKTPPGIELGGVPANTNNVLQTLTGELTEPTIQQPGAFMQIVQETLTPEGVAGTATVATIKTEGAFSVTVSLLEGTNTFIATAQDGGGLTTTKSVTVVADLSAPTATVSVVGVTSAGEVVTGDQYFLLIAASDPLSGVDSATLGGVVLSAIADVPPILRAMHGLDNVGETPTTHVALATVAEGTPIGVNDIFVTVTDKAGNSRQVQGELNVVSKRSNRNYFLFPGFNLMGLALIPDDNDSSTDDDDSMDRFMEQDVSDYVTDAFKTHMGTSTVTLGDVVESTFSFTRQGTFKVHTPGPAADSLTKLEPFQGMNINVLETVSEGQVQVFPKVEVEGFSAAQSVPIKINIEGVFVKQVAGELPPSYEMRVGYNLIAPHILDDTKFNTVFRGALVPRELAVSALSFERRVTASGEETGAITASIFEGFVTKSLGDVLNAELAYWTFIASDPLDTRLNSHEDPLGPTITVASSGD